MKQKLQGKCIYSIICIVIGIIVEVLARTLSNLSEMQSGYMDGFAISFIVVGILLFIKNITTLHNPKMLKKREIEQNDERNIQISIRSMAITFRVCILLEALGSVALVLLNDELGLYLGLLVSIQLIVYCVSNAIVSRKI